MQLRPFFHVTWTLSRSNINDANHRKTKWTLLHGAERYELAAGSKWTLDKNWYVFDALFVNYKLIFLNIKLKPKIQHTIIWPIYIYVHTVIRLYCCWDVKVTLSCLVFYSFVLSFIRWRWKITIIYLVYIHTLYVFSWK